MSQASDRAREVAEALVWSREMQRCLDLGDDPRHAHRSASLYLESLGGQCEVMGEVLKAEFGPKLTALAVRIGRALDAASRVRRRS